LPSPLLGPTPRAVLCVGRRKMPFRLWQDLHRNEEPHRLRVRANPTPVEVPGRHSLTERDGVAISLEHEIALLDDLPVADVLEHSRFLAHAGDHLLPLDRRPGAPGAHKIRRCSFVKHWRDRIDRYAEDP